jgi:hypothetical protein
LHESGQALVLTPRFNSSSSQRIATGQRAGCYRRRIVSESSGRAGGSHETGRTGRTRRAPERHHCL